MQRQGFGGPTAHSPPLHHPVPQHVSTVPMMRSPPPQDGSQANSGYASPYGGNVNQAQQNQSGQQFAPAFGGFMNDPTTAMGIQVGRTAMSMGQEYVDSHVRRYVSTIALKHYFNVTTGYVLKKLILVLVPWRHKPWSRQQRPAAAGGQEQGSYYFLPPREDLNSPDMYIPVMAFVTYILLSTLLAGMRGVFHPEVMGSTFMYAFLVVIGEILTLKAGTYFLNITNESQLLDLVAYAGYKFVGVIVTLIISETINRGQGTGGWVGWTVFIYTYMANAFFLLRSLKYVILPDSSGPASSGMTHTVAKSQRTARTQFLFVYSYVIQLVFMWILTRQDSSTGRAGKI